MAGFQYNYTPLSYDQAQKQALAQIDPLYQQGVKSVQQQQMYSNNQAGQVSAARGLGHSGLAADQLNKIAIATQGQIGALDAQRMTQANTMAQQLVDNDKQYDLQRRGQMYNEYSDNRNYNYGVSRDKVADSQWNQQFNYSKSVDDRNFKYQQGRDKVNDDWRQKEWSQMSPAEKQRMAQQYAYSQKGGKGRKGGGNNPKGSTSPGYLPNAGNQPITYEEYMRMVQSGGYTASSNKGRGNGKVQQGTNPEARKIHPIRY